MDYDDNDFQCQNFQLVGEDNNKFPASLRSLPLPKFDLEEHLQVHPRFDSLIGTEVLLGIQVHGNNWIDDFSPADSAIEFSSSAAEPCSISKHNNVWSEATSSESVEMLLKSVGEDEMIEQQTIKEANAHDGLNGMDADEQGCNASVVAGDSSDSISCGNTQHGHSSPSTSNPVMDPEKVNTQMISEQVMEECSKIDIGEKLSLLSDEGCNEPVFCENPTIDEIAPQKNEGYSLVMEGDGTIYQDSDKVNIDDISEPSHLREGYMNAGYGGSEYLSKDDTAYAESTLSIKNTNIVDRYYKARKLSSLLEVIEDKHDPEDQLTDGNNIDVRNTSRSSVKVHSSIDMSYELPTEETKNTDDLGFNPLNFNSPNPNITVVEKYAEDEVCENIVRRSEDKLNTPQDGILEEFPSSPALLMSCELPTEETKNDDGLGLNPVNFDSQNPDFTVVEKYAEDEVVENIVKKPEDKLNAPQDNKSENSLSPALLDDAEKISSSIPIKSFGMCDTGTLIAEPYDCRTIPPDVDAITKENTAPPLNSASIGPDSVDVNLHSLNNSTNVNQSQLGHTHAVDVLVEQKESTIPPLPASDFIQLEDKELEIDGSTILKSNLDVQISRESLDGLSAKDMIQDKPEFVVGVKVVSVKKLITSHQPESGDIMDVDVAMDKKEEPVSVLPVLDFIDSDGKETKTSEVTNLSVSSGPCILSNSDKDSPIASPTELHSIVIGQGSSSMEGSFCVALKSKLQYSTDNPARPENATRLEENLVSHVSSVIGKRNSDLLAAFAQEDKEKKLIASVEMDIRDERQEMPVPPSSVKFSGDFQKEQSAEGDDLNRCTNSSLESFAMTKTNAESNTVDAESANPSSFEENCGSPIVISCCEHSQDEMYREGNIELLDRMDPASDGPPFVSSGPRGNGSKVDSHESKENTTSEGDRGFAFEVGSLADLSERDNCNKWKPFSSFEFHQSSKENADEEMRLHGTITKALDEDKTKHISVCSNERLTTSQGKAAKETPILKQTSESDGNQWSASPKPVGTISRDMHMAEIDPSHYIESSIQTSCSPTSQMSTLPDLNTSVSSAAVFHQPFTDLQQVQLRAQIFVYGSLIQGTPPEEACMISAFGESDGGRSLWEAVCRASAERFQNQKSPFNGIETPRSHSGVQVSEQVTKCSSFQSGSKVVSSAILNSTIPLPSPPWSISTRDGLHSNTPRVTPLDFNQALSPVYSHQSSQTRQYTGNSATGLSQIPRTGPWVVSPATSLPTLSQNSALYATTQFSALPVTETVKVTPVRDSSIPGTLNIPVVSPTALLPTPGPAEIETQRKTTRGNNRSTTTVEKSRKRKKGSVAEELHPNIIVSQPLGKPDPVTGVTKHSPPTAAGLPVSANSLPKLVSTGFASATSHIIPPTHYQIIDIGDTDQRASKIEQAKLQAEDAAALAASVVRHSQGIWSELATQKNSGLISEADEKVASAAAVASAAVAVAKAAAAAAKVAADAALQAKLMADEALNLVKPGNLAQIPETGLLDVGKSLARLTPVSILKGRDKVHGSSLIISAAREAARRRVEAASAATKRAENLDAIVRAAELAAEAVSQAGTIIAMGEPLPLTLSELVEAGPESHWKVHYSTTLDGADNHDTSVETFNKQPSNNKEKQKITDGEGIFLFSEHAMQSKELLKGNGSGDASSTVPIDRHEKDHSAIIHIENSIQKGSHVEVVSDEDGLRRVWFSACVLDVKDGKAYVCYNDLLPDEGTGQLREWISLEGEGCKGPKIRLAHPMIAAKYEGTRKRRREAIGNYLWAVGDRVDAWIRDGWWEGIVTEKCQGDDTKVTVHFPAGGDSSVARSWNLRPSLVWKDGQWMEWARQNVLQLYEGDTPHEKRQKLCRLESRIDPEVDGNGTDKLSKNFPFEVTRKPLNLSSKDRTFLIGKNTREENKSDVLKGGQTGLQKEGLGVVFGVPKPGKKRKFMEVSKHYDENKTGKITEGNNSIKFAKYLMPQPSLAWRNSTKVDPKRKIASDSKSKGFKSVEPRGVQTRNIALKDNSSITTASNGRDNIEKKSLVEVDSLANSLESIESSHVERSVRPLPGVISSKKKSSAVMANLGGKGNLTRAMDKPTRSEEEGYKIPGNTISDALEPRRSNRRIQPTSRLLEGLQSSLLASKVPNFWHDKSNKAQQRAASSRGNSHC